MLSEPEKERIKLEEQYRIEIHKQLEEKSQKKSRVWIFLNSTFGLWLLSAIVITWAGTLYTQSQNRQAEGLKKQEAEREALSKKNELIERLDLEIGYRLSQCQIQLAYLVDIKDYDRRPLPFRPGMGEKDVKEVIDNLLQAPKGKFPPLYEEFSNISTLALIAELRRYVPPNERDEIDHVIADLSGIYIHIDVKKVKLSDIYGIARIIFDDITLYRWRKGDFYFLDCPFC
jgi:hypothetical protein